MRQLENKAEASRHERGEKSHRERLQDETAIGKAKEMIAKRTVPRRRIENTWIDLEGQFCYLCFIDFPTVEDTSRHEVLSKAHRANLSKEDVVRAGLDVLGIDHAAPRVVADPYVDISGRCCYLCQTEFTSEIQTRRHGWASTAHRRNLKDNETTKQADALVGGIHAVKPDVFPENFIDIPSISCLLCWKQFGTTDKLNEHGKHGLHRRNLANEEAVFSANLRLGRATGLDVDLTQDTSPEYRDRAAERRKAFGTSEKISLAFKKKGGRSDGPPAVKDPDPTPTPSKGAALLGKMGWQAGEGLGAQNTGMTAPIATDMYAQGVGLGAEGGKIGNAVEEAGRNTGGDYKEFVSRTRDKAKERYQNM